MNTMVFRLPILAAILSLSSFSQSEIGGASINGTVLDPSGAAIAGARVTTKSSQTGYTRTVTSNEAGLYTVSRVPVAV